MVPISRPMMVFLVCKFALVVAGISSVLLFGPPGIGN